MKRRKIDLFSSYELVTRLGPQVFYVVDEERIGESVLCEQDDLGAS